MERSHKNGIPCGMKFGKVWIIRQK